MEMRSFYVHIYIFCVVLSWEFFVFEHGQIECQWFSKGSILLILGPLIGTIILGQSGPGSNSDEGVLYTTQSPKLESLHSIQFSGIFNTACLQEFYSSAEIQT